MEDYIREWTMHGNPYYAVTIRHLGIRKVFNQSKFNLDMVRDWRDQQLKIYSVKHHNFLNGVVPIGW
tara:strand:- start:19 stop:219 length:201 start_codon:yes stop_codon:yes gene_type:complete